MLKFIWLFWCVLFVAHIDGRSVKRKGTPQLNSDDDVENWTGKWFPFAPNSQPTLKPHKQSQKLTKTDVPECDDAMHSIGIDFDPADKRHSYNYLCLDNRKMYEPNMKRKALLLEHFIPPAFKPAIRCINETIRYPERPPTSGSYRLLPPKYGSYQYIPPQRWVHSLAEGAIVLLYHPCAFSGQVNALEKVLRGCLYRHIITPSLDLSPERPLALIAWGKSLQMSVVDEKIVTKFIKENAKHGPIVKRDYSNDVKSYEAGLLSEAHLVTDMEDSEICGYQEM